MLYLRERRARPVTLHHPRPGARTANRVIAPFGLGRRFLGTHATWPAGPRGRRSGSGAASEHPHQRGLGGRTRHERRRLVASVAAGRQWTAVRRQFTPVPCRRESSFHLTGHLRRGPDRSSRSRRSPGSETPCPSPLTDIRLARNGRLSAASRPSQARLNQQMNDRSPSDMLRLPIRPARLRALAAATAIALLPVGITFATATAAPAAPLASPSRPQGPCDIYAAGGT